MVASLDLCSVNLSATAFGVAEQKSIAVVAYRAACRLERSRMVPALEPEGAMETLAASQEALVALVAVMNSQLGGLNQPDEHLELR